MIFPNCLNVETFLTHQWCTPQLQIQIFGHTYIHIYITYSIKNMASWEPVDIDPTDRDGIGEEDDKWGDDLMNNLERRFNELRQFNES